MFGCVMMLLMFATERLLSMHLGTRLANNVCLVCKKINAVVKTFCFIDKFIRSTLNVQCTHRFSTIIN